MGEETYTFEKARVRLEEIAGQARRKDVSLEKSLDLLEEGVRLANLCTERIDHTQWRAAVAEMTSDDEAAEAVVTDGTDGDAAAPGDRLDTTTGEAAATSGLSGVSADDEGSEAAEAVCEAPPAGAEAAGDLPSEDAHAAATEAAGEGDPDPEA